MGVKLISGLNEVGESCDLRFIIPTLNRPRELLKTVKWLLDATQSRANKLTIQVLISENASDSNLRLELKELESLSATPKGIGIYFLRQPTRLNVVHHMRVLSQTLGARWHFWCGDDDLCSPCYIQEVLNCIKDPDPCCAAIVPSYSNITQSEFFEKQNDMEEDCNQPVLYRLRDTRDWFAIYRGHQLSGLVFNSEIEIAVNSDLPKQNMYPWISYLANAASRSGILYYRNYKTLVTGGTPKLFSYGKNGLVPDIDEAVKCGLKNARFRGYLISCNILIRGHGYNRIRQTAGSKMGMLSSAFKLLREDKLRKITALIVLPFLLFRILKGR